MNELNTILNIKFPFIEAIEYLLDENSYIGICNSKLKKVIYIDGGILYPKTIHSSINLSIADILDDEWFLILRH